MRQQSVVRWISYTCNEILGCHGVEHKKMERDKNLLWWGLHQFLL